MYSVTRSMLRGGLQWMKEDRMKRITMIDSTVEVFNAFLVLYKWLINEKF